MGGVGAAAGGLVVELGRGRFAGGLVRKLQDVARLTVCYPRFRYEEAPMAQLARSLALPELPGLRIAAGEIFPR
jgi:hypothetical protein